MDGQGGTHGGQGAARRVGRAVRASGEDVGVGLASRVHAPGDGRGDGKCDIYFINHYAYLSASLLQPSGVEHDMCDRLSHVNE